MVCDLSQHIARMHESRNPRAKMRVDPVTCNDLLEVCCFPSSKFWVLLIRGLSFQKRETSTWHSKGFIDLKIETDTWPLGVPQTDEVYMLSVWLILIIKRKQSYYYTIEHKEACLKPKRFSVETFSTPIFHTKSYWETTVTEYKQDY